MNATILDSILILANPVIVIAQCIIFSKLLNKKDDMIERAFKDRWETLKEYMQYRHQIMEEKYKNEKDSISNIN